jgi:CheY-like chemotaxis protein
MAARLREHQLEVLTATGGLQAVRTLKEMKSLPKLMFIDRNMPDLSGMDVVRTVRRRYPEQPCFICGLTAYVDDAIINDMIDAGMDAVEQKPLNAEDLGRYLTPAQ